MKLKLTFLFIAFLFYSTTYSQIPTGSIAPDFTVQDINGEEHHLYGLLDEGKTVVIDIFATWCDACWNHHQEEILHQLWELNGPGGTDDYFVIMVEADPSTNNDALYGNAPNSQGDWVEGVPFPIVESSEIGSDFNISYFPSIYQICPNRVVRLMGQPDDVQIYYDAAESCLDFGGTNNAGIVSVSKFLSEACGEADYTPTMVIQNIGSDPISTATINMSVDGNIEETINWEGTMNSYELANINFTTELNFEEIDLEISISSVNGMSDDQPDDNLYSETLTASPIIDPGMVKLEIMTDEYGIDTYWAILDDNGEIVIAGGNEAVGLTNINGSGTIPPEDPTALQSDTLHTFEFSLPVEGCYSLVITDYFEDGICCSYGAGFYRFYDSAGNLVIEGGEFSNRIDHYFINGNIPSGVENILVEQNFRVNPTLVNQELNVDFDLKKMSDIEVSIIDLMGDAVLHKNLGNLSIGNHQEQFDLGHLAAGVYFIRLYTEYGFLTKRVIKI